MRNQYRPPFIFWIIFALFGYLVSSTQKDDITIYNNKFFKALQHIDLTGARNCKGELDLMAISPDCSTFRKPLRELVLPWYLRFVFLQWNQNKSGSQRKFPYHDYFIRLNIIKFLIEDCDCTLKRNIWYSKISKQGPIWDLLKFSKNIDHINIWKYLLEKHDSSPEGKIYLDVCHQIMASGKCKGETIFHRIVKLGSVDLLKLAFTKIQTELIQKFGNDAIEEEGRKFTNQKNSEGSTALSYALLHHDINFAKRLVEKLNADVHLTTGHSNLTGPELVITGCFVQLKNQVTPKTTDSDLEKMLEWLVREKKCTMLRHGENTLTLYKFAVERHCSKSILKIISNLETEELKQREQQLEKEELKQREQERKMNIISKKIETKDVPIKKELKPEVVEISHEGAHGIETKFAVRSRIKKKNRDTDQMKNQAIYIEISEDGKCTEMTRKSESPIQKKASDTDPMKNEEMHCKVCEDDEMYKEIDRKSESTTLKRKREEDEKNQENELFSETDEEEESEEIFLYEKIDMGLKREINTEKK